MIKLLGASAAIALAVSGAAQAQSNYSWGAPEAHTGDGQLFYLPMGTPLMLRTRTEISTKDNKPGDRVYLEVAENVSFRGQIVIPAGSPAVGEVGMVQRNGHVGKKGKLEVRLLYVQTPNGQARLVGRAYDEGKSGTVVSVGTMLFVSALGGFLIHGTSGYIMPDTPVQAQLSEPLRFRWYPDQQSASADGRQATPDEPVPARPGFSALNTAKTSG